MSDQSEEQCRLTEQIHGQKAYSEEIIQKSGKECQKYYEIYRYNVKHYPKGSVAAMRRFKKNVFLNNFFIK